MSLQDSSNAVSQKINQAISENIQQTNENLAWLTAQMHPMFFTLNPDEIDALSLLTTNLHKMDYHKRLLLVNRPKLTMVAQVDEEGSFYKSLEEFSNKPISYAEFTTSSATLPKTDETLEVLRIDFDRKQNSEVIEDLKSIKLPDDVLQKVSAILAKQFTSFDQAKTEKLLKLLMVNNPEYVRVSPAKRVARLLNLYAQTEAHDGIYLDVDTISKDTTAGKHRILLGTSNPPPMGYLLQLMEVLDRMNVSVRRSYSLILNNGLHPFFLSTFYVNMRDDSTLEKSTDIYKKLRREIYNTQILSTKSKTYRELVKPRICSGADASLVDAIIAFCNTNLSHINPDNFDNDTIMRAFHNHPEITTQLIELFHLRFRPNMDDREAKYQQALATANETIREFNSGRKHLDEFRRTVFKCAILFIQHTLKTNFFVTDKHALSFRIDPAYLEILGERFTADLPSDLPFRITFFYGSNGIGYHIGFSDIARGGWRTVITQGRDNYDTSANSVFKENYVLAHTQHLKNKDIYEGGSKMVALLRVLSSSNAEANRQQLYKLQMAFINAFFDLFVTENGKAKNKISSITISKTSRLSWVQMKICTM